MAYMVVFFIIKDKNQAVIAAFRCVSYRSCRDPMDKSEGSGID